MFNDIDGNALIAWTDIGIGARLAIAAHSALPSRKGEEWSRVYWSMYMLDHTYGASFSMPRAFSSQILGPPYPQSIPPPAQLSQETYLSSTFEDASAFGVDTFHLQLLTIWGNTMDFVRGMRDNEKVQVWSETGPYSGPYHKIICEMYDIEARAGDSHRLRNTGLTGRSPTELQTHRGYWAPWMAMQILIHTIQALIHHPFLHIINRRNNNTRRPPSFLQHTVDQALLHSSWVAKFIKFCAEKEFEINDPFIAHLASIAATVLMFFFDASDPSLTEQTAHGFETCYEFVQRMSKSWPHLANTIHKLDTLQRSRKPRFTPDSSVQASLLWSLFDYSSSTTPATSQDLPEPTVELNVNTQFLSSLDSIRTDRDKPRNQEQGFLPQETTHAQQSLPYIDASGFDQPFDIFNADWFTDMNMHDLGHGFWNDFGQ
ncbi:hypothetical protein N0V90_011888 [Kalmusia sp. IMI 367209]|nr:hypothetical protein N0V90_011888 [Kalmusia sp. IMI 367209]